MNMTNEEIDQKILEIERHLDTAANYGGGLDFATLMNIIRSILEIIKTLRGQR
jgi:hypothetical protein